MSIIDKLGITSGPWFKERPDHLEDYSIEHRFKYNGRILRGTLIDGIGSRKDAQLIATAPEMLEALIDNVIDNINHTFNETYSRLSRIHSQEDIMIRAEKTHNETINIIEKATGKSWEEIKALID